jgi:hypothetical protein
MFYRQSGHGEDSAMTLSDVGEYIAIRLVWEDHRIS